VPERFLNRGSAAPSLPTNHAKRQVPRFKQALPFLRSRNRKMFIPKSAKASNDVGFTKKYTFLQAANTRNLAAKSSRESDIFVDNASHFL
jgi:hypothetical protein